LAHRGEEILTKLSSDDNYIRKCQRRNTGVAKSLGITNTKENRSIHMNTNPLVSCLRIFGQRWKKRANNKTEVALWQKNQ
jgi:hypothetical protein